MPAPTYQCVRKCPFLGRVWQVGDILTAEQAGGEPIPKWFQPVEETPAKPVRRGRQKAQVTDGDPGEPA